MRFIIYFLIVYREKVTRTQIKVEMTDDRDINWMNQ